MLISIKSQITWVGRPSYNKLGGEMGKKYDIKTTHWCLKPNESNFSKYSQIGRYITCTHPCTSIRVWRLPDLEKGYHEGQGELPVWCAIITLTTVEIERKTTAPGYYRTLYILLTKQKR